MGAKGGGKIPVVDYRRSLHYAICHGPLDSINRIIIKDKVAWCGIATAREDIRLVLPDLFGGDKKEGGIDGVAEYYVGDTTQLASTELANRTSATPLTTPAYRRIASLFFRGRNDNGFKWGTNNPYLAETKVSVTALSTLLSDTYSAIYSPQSAELPYPVGPVNTGLFYGEDYSIPCGGRPMLYDDINNGSANTTPQGRFMDWTLWGYDNDNWVDYGDSWGFNLDVGTIVRDYRISGLDITDYHKANGTIDVTLTSRAIGLSGITVSVDSRLAIVGEDTDGLPLESGAYEVANSVTGLTDASEQTWSVTATIPADTKWLRWSFYQVEIIPGPGAGMRLYDADMKITWEAIVPPHCPSLSESGSGLGTLPNTNPAHLIYECLVDKSWGRGLDPSIIDTASFMAVAETLYDEGFGIYMFWAQRGTVETIIAEILSHIQANVYTNLRTGLLELKLLRADYDVGTLRVLDGSNSVVSNFHRRVISETTNELIVKWTNPETEKTETVRAQDLANITEQGTTVTTERDYYAIRSAQLAMKVAQRDLASMSALSASFTVSASREFWDITPGSVVKVTSEDDGVTELIARVNKVDRGQGGALPIVMECVEDVFGLEFAQYFDQPITGWQPVSPQPSVFTNTLIQTAPRALMVQAGVDPDDEYPRVMSVVAAEKPDRVTEGFDLFAPTIDTAGNSVVGNRGEMSPTDYGLISVAFTPEASTEVAAGFYTDFTGVEGPEEGALAFLGTDEGSSEIIMFSGYNSNNGVWTISRGMLDTVPRDWPVGTPLWFINTAFDALDQTDMSIGEVADYQLRPRSASENLSLALTPTVSYTMTDRASLPFRPAGLSVNTVSFVDPVVAVGADVVFEWVERDRLTEDSVLLSWGDATVTPEINQTTHIVVYDSGSNMVFEYSGLTVLAQTIPNVDIIDRVTTPYTVTIYSERDGLVSLQSHDQEFTVVGWGANQAAIAEQSLYVIDGPPRNKVQVAEQSLYVIDGRTSDKLAVAEQTLYVIDGRTSDKLAVAEQTLYVIDSVI